MLLPISLLGSSIWLCVFSSPAPKPLLLATFREAITWALVKGHTTFLSINSDLLYHLTKVTVPLRASYFLPDGWESLYLSPSRLKYKDSGESSQMLFRGRKQNQDSASLRGILWGFSIELLNPLTILSHQTRGSSFKKLLPFLLLTLLGFANMPRAYGSAAGLAVCKAQVLTKENRIWVCGKSWESRTQMPWRSSVGVCVHIFSLVCSLKRIMPELPVFPRSPNTVPGI